jgi:hypothetical protein
VRVQLASGPVADSAREPAKRLGAGVWADREANGSLPVSEVQPKLMVAAEQLL